MTSKSNKITAAENRLDLWLHQIQRRNQEEVGFCFAAFSLVALARFLTFDFVSAQSQAAAGMLLR